MPRRTTHSQFVLSRKISILQFLGYLHMVRALDEVCLAGVYRLHSLRAALSSSWTNFMHSLKMLWRETGAMG